MVAESTTVVAKGTRASGMSEKPVMSATAELERSLMVTGARLASARAGAGVAGVWAEA